MRVVFLTHNYPRWPGDYSGAALAVLARALVRRGVSVRVVALGGEDAAERTEQDGILIRRVRIPSRLGQTVFDQDAFAARLRSPRRWDVLLRLRRRLRLCRDSRQHKQAESEDETGHEIRVLHEAYATPVAVIAG